MPCSARPQPPATAAVNASGPSLGWPASAGPGDRRVAVDGEEQRAAGAVGRRQAGVVARLADGAGHLGEQLRGTWHGRREADSPRADIEPLDGREGRPDSTPDSSASGPRPYALRTAVPVTTTEPVPLRAVGAEVAAVHQSCDDPTLRSFSTSTAPVTVDMRAIMSSSTSSAP